MSGGVDTTVVAAFAVGFVSFISPCVLPLVPGYLSAVSGVTLAELQRGERANVLDACNGCRWPGDPDATETLRTPVYPYIRCEPQFRSVKST